MSSPGPGLTSPRGQSLVGAMLLRPKGVSSLKNNKLPRLLQGFFSIEHDMVPRPRRTAATMAAQTANPPHPAPDGDGTVSVDLQRWAPRGPVWETPPSRWVIFSDLHVSPRTLPVCMQILRHVHATATERSAGVAFLGDFWHVRGALPVEPLNDLVRMFATEWNVPALMLVGNHDQVSLGGMVHALTPLAAASPRWVHVFDGPAVYAGALWLPYRRNAHEVAAVLREASSSSAGVEAVFAHADVTGASLNDACQARDGLPPSLFPKGIPTYTGHYHKPHTVPGTSIRYVGSPYQVSRSEAGQDKALLVVDRTKGWQVVEEVPLDFGPRHFDAALQPAAGQNGNGGDPARALVLPEGLRRGDRVRVALPRDEVAAQKKAIKQLAAKGVAVEVVTLPSSETAAPRIENAELLRPMELFKQYTEVRGMSPTALARGVALLEGVAGGGAEGAAVAAAAHRSVSLAFNAVEVEGYFSFKEAQRYELADRGLVVVTGQVGGGASGEESSGMESNGAGKTALVMAPLWAITGDVDARSELGGGRGLTNADVVNEDAKFARVRVEGTVDGVPFSVERKVVRKGRGGGLTFELDGEDRTTQEIKLTQAAIDAALAAPLIGRAVFYGQSEITALLESGDRAFKEELGKVVDLDVWADAKEASRRVLSEKKTALDGCRRGEEREKADVAKFSAELARARREEEELQGAWQMNWAQAQHQAIEVATELHQAYVALQQELETVRAWMQQHQVHVQGGDESGAATAELVELDAELANVKAIMILREEELKQRSQAHSEAQKTQAAAQAHARGQQQRLEKFLTLGGDAAVCDRCLQPIDKPQFDEQVEQLTEKRQKAEGEAAACDAEVSVAAGLMQEAAQLFDSLRDEYSGLLQRRAGIVAQAKEAARAKAREHAEAESAVDMGEQAAAAAADCLDHLQSLLSSENPGWAAAAPLQPGGTSSVAMLRQTAQAVQTLIQAAQSSIREVDVLRRQQQSQNLQAQIQKLQAWVAEAEAKATSLSSQSDELAAEIEDLKAVDDAFKSTGVVSFVLEGALAALQDSASRHLAQLAPGITLELSATRPRASAGAKADSGSIEQVEKRIFVRLPGSNDLRARSVKQLSGGERRRVALALALGFTELAAHRGRLRCNLLVLDEVMQHLDGEGCARFAGLLRGLEEFSTVLLVAQAQSFMTQVFDAVDVVVKSGDGKDSPGSVIMQQGAASLPELVGVAD